MMAKRTRSAIEELADRLAASGRPAGRPYERLIEATAKHDRMLVGLYSLLAVGVVFLLFQAEMSVWAGAAMVAAWLLFLAGLVLSSTQVSAFNSLLLPEATDGESDEDEEYDEDLRNKVILTRLRFSGTYLLTLGLLCTGVAMAIDHWEPTWRALAVLGGIIALFLAVVFCHGMIVGRPEDRAKDTEAH
jgi:hypothetical protein